MANKKKIIPFLNSPLNVFSTLAFPALFPFGTGDFQINRPRTFDFVSDWAEHLLWYDDGRFAHHQYFKFVVHNMIMRKKELDNCNFVVNQKLGDKHLSVSELKNKINDGDNSIDKKLYIFRSITKWNYSILVPKRKRTQGFDSVSNK
jgi:hypothetical protein